MLWGSRRCRRRGRSLVELAIVLSLLCLFLFGLISGALGVYRSTQVAALAREGARYAATHGAQYAQDTGHPAATAQDIYNNAILPMAVGLNTSLLNGSEFTSGTAVTWNTSNAPMADNTSSTPPGTPVRNTVSVTVKYTWVPEVRYFGGLTLTSTSVMPMAY